MYTRLVSILVAGLLMPSGGKLAAQDTLQVGLREVMEQALRVSPEVGYVRADYGFAEARTDLARAGRFLTEFTSSSALSVAPGVTNPNGVDPQALYLDPAVRNDYSSLAPFAYTDVSLVQPVYTWGRVGASLDAASYGADAAAAAVAGMEREVALRTAELYFSVLLAEDFVRLTERAGDVVEQAKSEIARLLEEGSPDVDEAERYQVLITEQEFARRVTEVAEQRYVAYAGLRRQLMLGDSTTLVPADRVLEPVKFRLAGLGSYLTAALERPVVQRARAGLAARDALVRGARADYFPQVVLVASASLSGTTGRYRQPNPYISDGFRAARARTGIGIRQKLNFAQTRAKVAQARSELEAVEYRLRAAEQYVMFETEAAWREVRIRQSSLASQDSSLAITKEWLRVEYINFDLELGDTENLVKAVRANLEIEAHDLEAVRDYNMAVFRLLAASGLLRNGGTDILYE